MLFLHPGTHILLKWTKTLQDRSAHHFVQIPKLNNSHLCPIRAIRELIQSRPLPAHAPLFVHRNYPHTLVIDTTIRDALRTVLTHLHIPTRGHGFHSFRRSGATMAFDNNVQLQHIMAHGLWLSGMALFAERFCGSLHHSPHFCQGHSISYLVGACWFFRFYPKNLQTLHFNYNLLTCKIKIFPNNYQVL